MNMKELFGLVVEFETNEDDQFSPPAFLLNLDDEQLEAARDVAERIRMHMEDVLNYRQDMEEYNDVAAQ